MIRLCSINWYGQAMTVLSTTFRLPALLLSYLGSQEEDGAAFEWILSVGE